MVWCPNLKPQGQRKTIEKILLNKKVNILDAICYAVSCVCPDIAESEIDTRYSYQLHYYILIHV